MDTGDGLRVTVATVSIEGRVLGTQDLYPYVSRKLNLSKSKLVL